MRGRVDCGLVGRFAAGRRASAPEVRAVWRAYWRINRLMSEYAKTPDGVVSAGSP